MGAQIAKKILFSGKLIAQTGIAVGGTDVGLEIGGVDKIIVRHPITKQPYIPGSSIKGKMRSLLEKTLKGDKLKKKKNSNAPLIHICDPSETDIPCEICIVFGMPAETAKEFSNKKINEGKTFVTRLAVRDAAPIGDWLEKTEKNELPYVEVKTEVVIDRITSAATPRTFERVPAGAEFDLQLVLTIYQGDNETQFVNLIYEGLRLLQDDYLGGQGSRGYGQVKIKLESVTQRTRDDYITGEPGQNYTDVPIPSELQ